MFQKKFQNRVPKQESEDCEIDIKKTSQGRRIRFKGKCSNSEIEIAKENMIKKDMEE